MSRLDRFPYEITRVWIDESQGSCRGCGPCDVICPSVFRLSPAGKVRLLRDSGFTVDERYRVVEAAEQCAEGVIAYEVEGSGKRDNPRFGYP